MPKKDALPISRPSGENALARLDEWNALTARYGLSLTARDMDMLAEKRQEALTDSGRLEVGPGILGKLIYAFCDSPYLMEEDYAGALWELTDAFYSFKKDSRELVTDDELIAFLRDAYDESGGSMEYVTGLSVERLCHFPSFAEELDDGE